MVGIRTFLLGGLLAIGLAGAGTPAAANPFLIVAPPPEFTSKFSLRYWYGMGDTSKDLYGLTRDTLNSRLTYDGLRSHSFEIAARVDHRDGLFWKAYAGGGLLTQGNLQDEDFPPGTSPYSSTNSTLQNQSLGYISVDVGGALLRGPDFRVDAFVGYHYFHQRLKAFGCTQTATNPDICAGGISDSVAVIVEDDTWQAVRLGLAVEFPIADRLKVNVDAAWLPYTWLKGTDNHLLRSDLPSPIPEDGHGTGYQLEAMLSYQFDGQFSLGVGARYWHMESKGSADFSSAGGTTQPLDFKANIYGVFLQGSYKFNM